MVAGSEFSDCVSGTKCWGINSKFETGLARLYKGTFFKEGRGTNFIEYFAHLTHQY